MNFSQFENRPKTCLSLTATLIISSPNNDSTILGFFKDSKVPWPRHPSDPLPEIRNIDYKTQWPYF